MRQDESAASRRFHNRRVLAVVFLALAFVMLGFAISDHGRSVITRISDAVTAASLGLLALWSWRSGVVVGDDDITIHTVGHLSRGRPVIRWADVDGFDAPEARLSGKVGTGYVELHLVSGDALRLPNVWDKHALTEALAGRLGPPHPR